MSKQLTSKQNFKMEKSKFQVLIKLYFLREKTVFETKVNIIHALVRRIEWFKSDSPNFVGVVRVQKFNLVQVIRMKS